MMGKGTPVPQNKENSVERFLDPWSSSPWIWNKIFLLSCVIGVSIDPLFLYILVVDKDQKCLAADKSMKYVALILRFVTDISYLFHFVFRLQSAREMAKELKKSVLTNIPWWYLLIDILAIVPLPQVIVLKYFSKLAGSRTLTARKVLNVLLLLQYVPRLLRVYLTGIELGRSFDLLTIRVWARGAFFFFLYIILGHIFGALWYFYAIFRETACWHHACLSITGCDPINFDCRSPNLMKNITYLNEFCPVDTPNAAHVYDYGIFSEAIESGILTSRGFLEKFSRCFWWGLRNLSSFGQNLETSANTLENFFAALISILGLLSFLYLIGNLQTYMQLATTKSEEGRRKLSVKQPEIDSFLSSHTLSRHKKKVIFRYLQSTIVDDKDFDFNHLLSLLEEHSEPHQKNKEHENFAAWVTKVVDANKQEKTALYATAEIWISKNGFSPDMKQKIMRYVKLRLQEVKHVDVGNILPILPSELGLLVKFFLCIPTLQKVPMLQNMDHNLYETICNHLKPVVYTEKSYIIRKDEPLDFILLVTQGVAWCFASGSSQPERLERGDFYGKELLEWELQPETDAKFPISSANLKCHTKLEAFVLMAVDLENMLSVCWTKFCRPGKPIPEGFKRFAAATLQQGFRRHNRNKKTKENSVDIVTQA